MAKTNEDAVLRIRAKNLATKELREVARELDHLTEVQQENGDAAKLAARNLNDLKIEYKNLQAIQKELGRRNELATRLKQDKAAIGETQAKLRALTAELERLNALKTAGVPVKGLNREISKTENAIKATNVRLSEQTKRFGDAAEKAKSLGINAARTAQSIEQINQESARTAELVQQSEAAMNGYAAAVRTAQGALRDQQQAQRAITEEAQRRMALEEKAFHQRSQEANALFADMKRIEQKRADAIHAFTAAPTGEQFGPGNAAGLAERDAARMASAQERANAEVQRAAAFRERLIAVLRRQKDGGDRLIANDGKLAEATRKVSAALDKQAGSMDRTHKLGGLLADTGRKSLSVYQRLRGQILATAAAYVGLYQAVNLVGAAVTKEQERRRIDIQLRVANKGDAEAAKRDVDFLRAQADRLGLVYEDIAKNFANYKIAGEAVGLTNKTIKASFIDATEIVTGLGLSADDAEGVFRAFVQILGKARVQAEELRGQLGDRLPGAVAKFAEANKIQLNQLDAYLKKGKGNVQNFLNFLRDYAKTTKIGVEENSRTLFAQFNRLKNAYGDFLVQFSKGGVSSGLLDVVNQLLLKLKGAEGGKFARELADAFSQVGKVLLFVIDNFSAFIELLKLYLKLQVAKAIVSFFASFVIGANQVYKGAKAIQVFAAATWEAQKAGTALTLSQRGLLALMSPVGIAVVAAAATFLVLRNNINQADKAMENFIADQERVAHLKGTARMEGIREQQAQLKDLLEQERELKDEQTRLVRMGDTGGLSNPLGTLIDMAAGTKLSLHGVNEQLDLTQSKIFTLSNSIIQNSKVQTAESNRAIAAAKAEAAQRDKLVDPTAPTDPEATAKAAEAAAKAADVLAEKRHDIADRSARELLDVEKSLQEARIAANASTQEQITANYKQSLQVISTEVAKRRSELESLKHDAERAGSPEGVKSAQAAIDLLPKLEEELQKKERLQMLTDSIALGEQKVNDLIAQRDAAIDVINTKVELGLMSEVDGRQAAIDKQLEYKDKILGTITAFVAQLEALKASDPDLAKILHVDELIDKMAVAALHTKDVVTTTQLIAKNLGGQLSQGVTSFFSTFIKGALGAIDGVNGIAEAFKNAKDGFLNFLADFLVGIGEAILKAILLQAIMNAVNGTKGGFTAAALGALTGHTGGVVRAGGIGSGNPIRQVSAALFAGAERFHDGGLPGLKAGEVPAILKKREEVLTADDPRNVLNGGLTPAGQKVGVTVINGVDSRDLYEAGANTRSGETVFYNLLRANKRTVRKILGIA